MKANLLFNDHNRTYPDEIADLESLLIFLMDEIQRTNRILVNLKVDGEDLVEAYPHQAREMGLDTIGTVVIEAKTAEHFSSDFLREASEFIDHLRCGFELTIHLFRENGKVESAYDMLARCFDSLSAIRNLLNDVYAVEGKVDPLLWDDFGEMADRIRNAQMELQPMEIAGLLESQMLPFLDEWKLAA